MKLKFEEEVDFSIDVNDVISALSNVKSSGSNQWTALCPAHNDHRNSLSIGKTADGKVLLHCHANCEYLDIISSLGLYKEVKSQNKEISATYDYYDADGELVYQVVRFTPKGFAQRRPDGSGGWIYNLKGVTRVLYNLPSLMESYGTVYVVEGEKDADKLISLGLVATTNSGGAGKWLKEYNKYFKALDVVIIPDNDQAGMEHAELVSKNVYRVANSVKILKLDGLKEKQDLFDWLQTHTKDDLTVLSELNDTLKYEEEDLETDHTLPSYVEGEMAILGAILRDGRLISKAVESNVVKDFYHNKNRVILKAMLECFENKSGVDYITVAEQLKKSGKLEYVGGIDYLKLLRTDAPDTLNVDSWIKSVSSKADLRNYITIADKLTKTAYGELEDPSRIGDNLAQDVFKLRRKDGKKSFTHVTDDVEDIFEQVRNLDGTAVTGITTGFVELDKITAGFQKTDLVLVAGRPSMGKTSLAMNMAYNAATNGHNVAVFSLEMGKDQLIKRILCSEARVDSALFRTGNLDVNDWTRLAKVVPQMRSSGLYIDDTPSISISEMRTKLFNLKESLLLGSEEHLNYSNLGMVVVDYIQLMAGKGRESRQQDVSEISRELKGLAKELDVPIVAVSQLSRAPEGRNPPRPLMSDLRESGSLEQDADTVMFVFRSEYYDPTPDNQGLADIIVAKQRNGPTGVIDLAWLNKFSRFENLIELQRKIKGL